MNRFRKAAIVIITYNNLEYNKTCLESIRKYTPKDSCEIVVVDNHSTDGTREWLKEQPNILLKLNDSNVGFPKGCNMGIALASADSDILLLNNDTVVTPNWLENLQTCLYSNERIGATGAVSNHNENLQGVDFSYNDLEEMEQLAEKNNVSDSEKWEEKVFLIGFCILIRREVLNKVGLLSEEYSPGYVEDNDLSIRILTAGYKLMLCHDCFIHHYLGTGFRKDLTKFYPVLFRNREIFRQRWGFQTYWFDELDYASLRIFDKPDRQEEIRVLEIGCGLGLDLLKIKYACPNALLFGIEPDEKLALVAERVAKVSSFPLESFPYPFKENYFDYIFIGNYLEKAASPERFLVEIKKLLKEGGTVLGRFQNAMHYSVIQSLLQGNWQYAHDKMNRANRYHYTLNDIQHLFAGCGYKSPYVFHWFSTPSEKDKDFIDKICKEADEKRSFLYYTYLYSVKYQK